MKKAQQSRSSTDDTIVLGPRFPLMAIESKKRGRCLVSLKDVPAGATIEVAPVQVLPRALVPHIEAQKLDFFIVWKVGESRQKQLAMPMGLAGLCNHSDDPNAAIINDHANRQIRLVALRTICGGDEVTVRYRDPSRSYSGIRDIK